MSTPNPLVTAATPELIALIQALMQFETNIGPDPLKWVATVPGALTILLGTVQLQLPALGISEITALQADINARLAAILAKLQNPPAA
jgi:hypothetical protein